MPGLETIPLRIPERWDPSWFRDFVRDVLSLADARNVIAGAGITVEGTPDTPASISASDELDDLLSGRFVLVSAESFLPQARVLAEGQGIDFQDGGAGGFLVIRIPPNGVTLDRIAETGALTVLGNKINAAGNVGVVSANANDTVLRRTGDALDFGQLTVDMAADELWTKAKLETDVQDTLTWAKEAQTAYTVATLPASPSLYQRAIVTDATAPTFLGTLVGGGAVVCPALWDGTNWIAA